MLWILRLASVLVTVSTSAALLPLMKDTAGPNAGLIIMIVYSAGD